MRILNGDMFKHCQNNDALCVTTNGILNKYGDAIMGAGIAKTFRDKFKGIDSKLGDLIKNEGNNVFFLGTAYAKNRDIRVSLFSFPTKHNWKQKSNLNLIEKSCIQLLQLIKDYDIKGNIYIPAPGCKNGGLNWESDVKPLIEKYFMEDRYIICFK